MLFSLCVQNFKKKPSYLLKIIKELNRNNHNIEHNNELEEVICKTPSLIYDYFNVFGKISESSECILAKNTYKSICYLKKLKQNNFALAHIQEKFIFCASKKAENAVHYARFSGNRVNDESVFLKAPYYLILNYSKIVGKLTIHEELEKLAKIDKNSFLKEYLRQASF